MVNNLMRRSCVPKGAGSFFLSGGGQRNKNLRKGSKG